jgi:hypothetical protein
VRRKMRRRSTRVVLWAALILAGLTALAMPAVAARPGMTVKIPARQDVDRVYALAAIHQKRCSLQVSGSAMGHRFKTFRKSRVTIHLTNQAYLRLSSSAKRSVKKARRRGKTVRAKVTVTARNASGSRNTVTRSITLKD